jgi:hypothetical protein
MKNTTKRLIVPKLRSFDFEHCRVCGVKVDEAHEAYARRNVYNAICGVECHCKEELARYACCEKAVQNPCVCNYSTICPDHGRRCNGTHD